VNNLPGAIPHLLAGFSTIAIGRLYFKNYFKDDNEYKKMLYLVLICIFFSHIADFFLILHYGIGLFDFCTILPYHDLLHVILFVIAILGLSLILILKPKNKPIWIMGMLCILLHITMDVVAPDTYPNIWI
jgi:hypothetical protein